MNDANIKDILKYLPHRYPFLLVDKVVGVGDLLILLGDWGSCPGCPADLDCDGVVGVTDLLVLLGNWSS